jgi:hypothetical protein
LYYGKFILTHYGARTNAAGFDGRMRISASLTRREASPPHRMIPGILYVKDWLTGKFLGNGLSGWYVGARLSTQRA